MASQLESAQPRRAATRVGYETKFKLRPRPQARRRMKFSQLVSHEIAQAFNVKEAVAQTLRARGLDEGREEEVCGGDEECEEGEVGPPLGAVAGRDHEEVVGQVEEEGGKVAEGADHVPLVALPGDQPVVLHHLVDRGPRLNPGVQFNTTLITLTTQKSLCGC